MLPLSSAPLGAHPHCTSSLHSTGSIFRFPGARVHQQVSVPDEALAREGVCPYGAAKDPGAGAQSERAAAEGTGHLSLLLPILFPQLAPYIGIGGIYLNLRVLSTCLEHSPEPALLS